MKVKGDLQIKNQRLGFVVQQVESVITSASGTTATPAVDNSIPQITEGDQVLTLTITPQRIGNIVLLDVVGMANHSSGGSVIVSIHRVGTSDALETTYFYAIAGGGVPFSLTYRDTATGVAAVEYTVRVGVNLGGTYALGFGTGYFGTANRVILRATEYSLS